VLREKQMAERRGRILDAAERLIRATGGTDFSMLAVAQAAEVSPATPYNLFRSKGGVLYALLNRSLDQIAREGLAFTSDDPIERVLEAATIAADTFTHDPVFLRPLYRVLVGVHDPVHRPRFLQRSLEFWKTALEAAGRDGLFSKEVDRDELARELMIHFLGVLDLWVHEELGEPAFHSQILYGSILLLSTIAGPDRPRLWRRLRAAKRKLPRKFSFEPAPARELVTSIPVIHNGRSR
jgi:AcrR family transcriptional regulator